MWDELLSRHPHLAIDNCASGGRRIDLETVGRSTALWRTDWPADSLHKQCHTFGLLSWERTYAIAFFLLLVAMPLSVYAIARRAAGVWHLGGPNPRCTRPE
jgi:hypothetical protein